METVIVTLRSEGFEKDMELPCKIPLEELYPRLTTALQNASTLRFGDFIGVVLEKDGAGMLTLGATLMDYGVCTGSILDVVKKEKYDGFYKGGGR